MNQLLMDFARAHHVYYGLAGFVLGTLGPKIVDLMLTRGIDFVVPKILTFQKFYLKKIGATDSQIDAIETREAAGLKRAGDDIDATIKQESGSV